MSIQVKRRRIRLPIDTSKFNAPSDALTNSGARCWNGSPAQFEIGLKYGTSFIDDLDNLVELTLQIKAAGSNNSAPAEDAEVLATETVSSFDDTLDATTWENGSKQHALITFSGAQLKLGAGNFWMILVATIDGESEPITLAAGLLVIAGDGYENGAGEAPDPAASYLNTEQSDARYGQRGVNTPDYRSDITALTGGASNALDSLATTTKSAGYLIEIVLSGGAGRKSYQLQSGTDAESSPGIIRPDDYAPTTNEKIWVSV